MGVQGFLEKARHAHVVSMTEQSKRLDKLKFEEQTVWMAQHGNLDAFVPSWEREQGVVLTTLSAEVVEVSNFEQIWHER